MNNEKKLEIVFAPETARLVSNFVVRGFFTPGELPQALARMQIIEVTHPPSAEVRQTIERLEAALARSTVASFDFHLTYPEQGLFSR